MALQIDVNTKYVFQQNVDKTNCINNAKYQVGRLAIRLKKNLSGSLSHSLSLDRGHVTTTTFPQFNSIMNRTTNTVDVCIHTIVVVGQN